MKDWRLSFVMNGAEFTFANVTCKKPERTKLWKVLESMLDHEKVDSIKYNEINS